MIIDFYLPYFIFKLDNPNPYIVYSNVHKLYLVKIFTEQNKINYASSILSANI